jgi:hypothetical protein
MLGLTWFQTGTTRKEPAVHSAFQPLNKGGHSLFRATSHKASHFIETLVLLMREKVFVNVFVFPNFFPQT